MFTVKRLTVAAQLIIAAAAVGAFLLSWSNSSSIDKTNKSIQKVEHTFNSRMEEFIDLVKETSNAKGVEKGVKQERARQKEQDEK